MRSLKKLFTIMLVLGFAAPVWADNEDWLKYCVSGRTTTALQQGEYACATFGDSSTLNGESKMLGVSACENFDVFMFPDIDGTADDAATVQIYSCAAATDASGDAPPATGWSATGLCWILENVTLDGDPATNTEATYGASGVFIYALAASIDASPNTDDPMVVVSCHGTR